MLKKMRIITFLGVVSLVLTACGNHSNGAVLPSDKRSEELIFSAGTVTEHPSETQSKEPSETPSEEPRPSETLSEEPSEEPRPSEEPSETPSEESRPSETPSEESRPSETPSEESRPSETPSEEPSEFDKLIENFVPGSFNTFILKVGDVHKPNAAVWLSSGKGTVYSSDENVVTISEYGKVTAVGKGTAYIVIVAITGMSQVYQYIVQ